MHNKSHYLGKVYGKKSGPTIVAFGGIHGNEPAGVLALESVLEKIMKYDLRLEGNFFAVKGNIEALNVGLRYIDQDLNRMWTRREVKGLRNNKGDAAELSQQKELHRIIQEIFSTTSGPYYFVDLHTTSSRSIPFITISDSLNNRKFASKFNYPIILGIEEFLDGPLLTFMNEFGHISLGFEAGKHDDASSIFNCETFLWKTMRFSKCIDRKSLKKINQSDGVQFENKGRRRFYHIKYKYGIGLLESFKMLPNFNNFGKIKRGDTLAVSDGRFVKAPMKGKIFMPLYQKKGNDGFFIIRKVSIFWLHLSKYLRKSRMHEFLQILPGVKKVSSYTLRVNPKTARFLATNIFHLFGYRKRTIRGNRLFFSRRDRKITQFY